MANRTPASHPRYVALLRAVNLGPHNKVSMAALREVADALGFAEAQTLLQSGNLVFADPEARSTAKLEQLIGAAVARKCGVSTEIFVRDAREWKAIVAANPFPAEAKRDPSHLVVACGRESIPADRIEALQRAIVGREQVRAAGRELFVYYPDGIGRSKLTASFMSRHLDANGGTARNWNTVQKIAQLLASA
jgi:uncharacterized protein (DUF1697 family)